MQNSVPYGTKFCRKILSCMGQSFAVADEDVGGIGVLAKIVVMEMARGPSIACDGGDGPFGCGPAALGTIRGPAATQAPQCIALPYHERYACRRPKCNPPPESHVNGPNGKWIPRGADPATVTGPRTNAIPHAEGPDKCGFIREIRESPFSQSCALASLCGGFGWVGMDGATPPANASALDWRRFFWPAG